MIDEPEFMPALEANWSAIEKTAARSLKRSAKGFLPEDPAERKCVLGYGSYGCVWPTADPRFVLKASFDATEGPVVATLVKKFRLHPGLAYFHGIWRLPKLYWSNEFGLTPIWIFLREEVNFPKLKKTPLGEALEESSGAATELCDAIAEKQDQQSLRDHTREFVAAIKNVDRGKGKKVAKLLRDALKRGVILGDTHTGNVGQRCHDLSQFKVPRHKDLVITDVGDPHQPPLTTDRHPTIRDVRRNCFTC